MRFPVVRRLSLSALCVFNLLIGKTTNSKLLLTSSTEMMPFSTFFLAIDAHFSTVYDRTIEKRNKPFSPLQNTLNECPFACEVRLYGVKRYCTLSPTKGPHTEVYTLSVADSHRLERLLVAKYLNLRGFATWSRWLASWRKKSLSRK